MMLYAYGVKKVYGIKGGFKGKSMRLQPLPLHIFKSCWDTTPWSKWSGVVNPQCWITLTPENVQDIHLQGIYWDALIPLQIATWRSTTETGNVSMREISRNNKWVGGLAWRAWYSRFIWSSKPSRACYDSRIAIFVCPYETTVSTWHLVSMVCFAKFSPWVRLNRVKNLHWRWIYSGQRPWKPSSSWDGSGLATRFVSWGLGLNASQGALFVEMVRSQMT